MDAMTEPLEELPTVTPAAASTDRCPNCGAPLAADQRYCIQCGERRSGGGLRDSLPRQQVAAAAPVKTRRTLAATPNSSLIAGVATLLLAMGVGVLIGRTGDHTNTARSATPQVVTVQTNGAAGAGTATTAAATTGSSSGSSSTKSSKHKKASSHKKTVAAHNTDVQKTAAKNGVKLPPPVVKVGQSCTKGTAGCSGGKFTGNYFGG